MGFEHCMEIFKVHLLFCFNPSRVDIFQLHMYLFFGFFFFFTSLYDLFLRKDTFDNFSG